MVDDTLDAKFEQFNIEIDEQADFISRDLETGKKLCAVDREELIYRFNFNDNQVFY